MTKKILIIGGAGFIGSNICEKLVEKKINFDLTYFKKKAQIYSSKTKHINVDLKNKNHITKIIQKYDYIIMCGGKIFNSRANSNLLDDYNENVNIHLNVINAICKSKIKKYLWFSSCTGYPNSNQKMKENIFFLNDPYSYHKLPGWHSRFIEKVIESYSSSIKTKFITIRVPEVYGKYDNYDFKTCRNVPFLINNFYFNKKHKIKLNLYLKKNYIFSGDLANLSLKTLWKSNKKYDVFNICNDKLNNLEDFVKNIKKYYNNNINFKVLNNLNIIKSRSFCNKKIKKFLKIEKIGNINLSLKQTLDWYSFKKKY